MRLGKLPVIRGAYFYVTKSNLSYNLILELCYLICNVCNGKFNLVKVGGYLTCMYFVWTVIRNEFSL